MIAGHLPRILDLGFEYLFVQYLNQVQTCHPLSNHGSCAKVKPLLHFHVGTKTKVCVSLGEPPHGYFPFGVPVPLPKKKYCTSRA